MKEVHSGGDSTPLASSQSKEPLATYLLTSNGACCSSSGRRGVGSELPVAEAAVGTVCSWLFAAAGDGVEQNRMQRTLSRKPLSAPISADLSR